MLFGGAGADAFDGGAGGDRVDYTTAGAGIAGYVRPNDVTAVVYAAGRMKELSLPPNGVWSSTDLSASLRAPQSQPIRWPTGFVRRGGTASVVYGNGEGFIHELAFVAGKWVMTHISEVANAPKLTGQQGVKGYVRVDGVAAAIYCGVDNHIHELTLVDGRWIHADLPSGANAPPGSIPFGYVRSDGVTSVIYTGTDNHIHELSLALP